MADAVRLAREALAQIHEGACRTSQDSRSRDDDRYCISSVMRTAEAALAALPTPEAIADLERKAATTIGGIAAIAAERERQMSVEGWTSQHDDAHSSGEMARAAICYASPVPIMALLPVDCGCRSVGECTHTLSPRRAYIDPWPWDPKWDKRKKHDRRRRLVIAGALTAAEIDRLDREAKQENPHV